MYVIFQHFGGCLCKPHVHWAIFNVNVNFDWFLSIFRLKLLIIQKNRKYTLIPRSHGSPRLNCFVSHWQWKISLHGVSNPAYTWVHWVSVGGLLEKVIFFGVIFSQNFKFIYFHGTPTYFLLHICNLLTFREVLAQTPCF